MTLETPNRLRACAVLLLDQETSPDSMSFRSRNGFATLSTIIISAGADLVADMTMDDGGKVNNDEGVILVSVDDPTNYNVGAWISPEHSARSIPALDDMDPYHACVEVIYEAKGLGARFYVAVFAVIETEGEPIEGEPLS